jgi:hypothetical protein
MVKREAVVGFCRYWKTQELEKQVEQINSLGNELEILQRKYHQKQMDKSEFSQEFGIKSMQMIQLRRLANDTMIKSKMFQMRK